MFEALGDAVAEAKVSVEDAIHDLLNKDNKWENWGQNQECYPKHIFRPKRLADLKAIVKEAAKQNKKVRCVAQGHSWSSLSVTNDYLVITTDLDKVTVQNDEKYGWTVTAESGAKIAQIDEALRNHDPPLALESITVIDYFRAGGVVGTGSHGAKIEGGIIADDVVAISVVTSNGELVEFSDDKDREEMAAARCNLGLLGIMYSLTWRTSPMFRLRVIDFKPPLESWWNAPTLKEIVSRSHSLEIFYWPFNTGDLSVADDMFWVKQWVRTDDPVTITKAERSVDLFFMELGTGFGEPLWQSIANNPKSTPHLLHLLFNSAAKPSNEVLEAPDALHFLGNVDKILVMDTEVAFKVNDDFSNVIDAVNNTITKVYDLAKNGQFPLNVTLELRIHKGSQALLSNAYDADPNAHYCSLEVLSANGTEGYEKFSSDLVLEWMKKYGARPHWGKMWEHVPGIIPLLREKLGDRRERFNKIREKYDPSGMFFDNQSLRGIIADQ